MKIKNFTHKVSYYTCYYFNDIIRDFDVNFDNILLDEKLYENIPVYDILYKTSTNAKPLRITLDIIDGFIRVRGSEFRYLVLFDHGLFDKICDEFKYLMSKKSSIKDSINHNFGQIRIYSYNSLTIEKILTFHVITIIKSVVNKNKTNTTIIYFLKKVRIKINLIQDIFKKMFAYYKCYILIELKFLKELMSIKQVHQNCLIFVTIGMS